MSRGAQAEAYLEAARQSRRAAQLIYRSAIGTGDPLWAPVVKNGYAAMEQAVSAALAAGDEPIPRSHPAKLNAFLANYQVSATLEATLLEWLRRRSDAQYVDIRGDELSVPHEQFDRADATRILDDADRVLEFSTELIRE